MSKWEEVAGRDAGSPWRMPARAWKAILGRTWTRSWSDNVGLVAAGVTYYGFLALVPLLGVIVLVYGFVADPQTVVATMDSLTAILPGEVARAIGEMLMDAVQSSGQAKGLGLVIAVIVALYGASNGAGAIMAALNIAYQEREKRSLLHYYGLSLLMTLAAVVLAVGALAATAAVAALDRMFPAAPDSGVLLGKLALYALLTLAAAAVAATLYRYAPSREEARWEWITPGSLSTAALWLLLTVAFGFYVTELSDYSATYGSLGGIIALLTWMYLSAYVFVFGAELNSEVEHQTARDSTTGAPMPLGERGAWAADHYAGDESPEEQKKGISMAEATPEPPTEQQP